jgi:hypothetical protein
MLLEAAIPCVPYVPGWLMTSAPFAQVHWLAPLGAGALLLPPLPHAEKESAAIIITINMNTRDFFPSTILNLRFHLRNPDNGRF